MHESIPPSVDWPARAHLLYAADQVWQPAPRAGLSRVKLNPTRRPANAEQAAISLGLGRLAAPKFADFADTPAAAAILDWCDSFSWKSWTGEARVWLLDVATSTAWCEQQGIAAPDEWIVAPGSAPRLSFHAFDVTTSPDGSFQARRLDWIPAREDREQFRQRALRLFRDQLTEYMGQVEAYYGARCEYETTARAARCYARHLKGETWPTISRAEGYDKLHQDDIGSPRKAAAAFARRAGLPMHEKTPRAATGRDFGRTRDEKQRQITVRQG